MNNSKSHVKGMTDCRVPKDSLISRQAAIDFIDAGHLCNPNEPRWSDNEVVNFLKSRPSVHPETCDTCKHGYFGDEQCNDCRVRFTSHYERRNDGSD